MHTNESLRPLLRVMLAHPGTQYCHRLAIELHRHGLLDSFHTGLAFTGNSIASRLFTETCHVLGMSRTSQNRYNPALPSSKVYIYPVLELVAQCRMRLGTPALRVFRERNAAFQAAIPQRFIEGSDAVIGFDTSSLVLARRRKAATTLLFLDQSIGHPRTLKRYMQEWQRRWPEWAAGEKMKQDAEIADEEAEHREADVIVAPSRFVARTLVENGVSEGKIQLNPFGTDLSLFTPSESPPDLDRKMTFLFVGTVGVRKGVPILLEAWRQLAPTNAELWIAGPGRPPESVTRDCPRSIRWLGPVAREQLPGILRSSHVFVFPSLFEGLAQVQIEAAACGLPVIGTKASGAEEIVEHGRTGFLVKPGSAEDLAQAMDVFLRHPERIWEMRDRVLADRNLLCWSEYGNRWRKILAQVTPSCRTTRQL